MATSEDINLAIDTDQEDIAEILDVSTNERLSSTKGANVDFDQYDWNKIAKTISRTYGKQVKASTVRKMFEDTVKAAKGNSKEIAQSVLAGIASKSADKGEPITPRSAAAVAESMTESGVRQFAAGLSVGPTYKTGSDGLPASDRDFYGRKKKRAELNEGNK